MSKKGAFIYQQIELTTAEWADPITQPFTLHQSGYLNVWKTVNST